MKSTTKFLLFIYKYPNTTFTELKDFYGLTKGRTSQILKYLNEKGYIIKIHKSLETFNGKTYVKELLITREGFLYMLFGTRIKKLSNKGIKLLFVFITKFEQFYSQWRRYDYNYNAMKNIPNIVKSVQDYYSMSDLRKRYSLLVYNGIDFWNIIKELQKDKFIEEAGIKLSETSSLGGAMYKLKNIEILGTDLNTLVVKTKQPIEV